MTKHLLVILVLAQASTVFSADRPWSVDVKIDGGKNTNIGNGDRGRDTIDDNFGIFTAGGNYSWGFGPQAITVRAFAETEQIDKISHLSRYTGGAQFLYRRQLGSLPTSTSVETKLSVQVDDYRVNQRDSTIASAQLMATKPVFGRAHMSAGAEYWYRDSEGSVWDLDHVRGFLNGGVSFLRGWSAYGTYSILKGDVASTAQTRFSDGSVPGDIFGLIDAAKKIEPDKAFNKHFSDRRWTAYRLSAVSQAGKAGIIKQFPHNFTLDVSVFSVWVNAKADNEYDTQIYRASLLKRF
jgi:hypothetical protein